MTTRKAVMYRAYSKYNPDGTKEDWGKITDRCLKGIENFGGIDIEEIRPLMLNFHVLPSGRWLWVGGTEWIEKPQNYSGAYNCSSTFVSDQKAFGDMAMLGMCGCGIGFVLTQDLISQLPKVHNKILLTFVGEPGDVPAESRMENTFLVDNSDLYVGDSREGWCDAYQTLFDLAFSTSLPGEVKLTVHLGNVRPRGEAIKGFGGKANPDGLKTMLEGVSEDLTDAHGRQLNSVELCLLINRIGLVIEQGGVRRLAGIAQFDESDLLARDAKKDMWKVDDQGNWSIDPKKNPLRMANHTLVFHKKPTLQQVIESVRRQFETGEGAIQWAGEAVARCNAEILDTDDKRKEFLAYYEENHKYPELMVAKLKELNETGFYFSEEEYKYRIKLFGLNPCGEIPFGDNHCNLTEVHLNTIDPLDFETQRKSFIAAANLATPLLKHKFTIPRYQKGREFDPIVGVSISGSFDFFIKLFGTDYVKWWENGRPDEWETRHVDDIKHIAEVRVTIEDFSGLEFSEKASEFYREVEAWYYLRWRMIVEETVTDYCHRENLRVPNRCTTVQPSGTKSLLSEGSPGCHPTWGGYYIRRIKFTKDDPVAISLIEAGYSHVRSQNDIANGKDESKDIETIIEFPCKAGWIDHVDESRLDVDNLVWPALAHFDFYMIMQKHYTKHNGSVTINLGEEEIIPLSTKIYEAIQDDEGYISAALLARFDAPFPNLPFERVSKKIYQEMINNLKEGSNYDLDYLVQKHTINSDNQIDYNQYQAPCSSEKCTI